MAVWGAMGSSLVPSRCLFAHRRVVLFPTNLLLFSQSSAFSRRNVLESQRLFLPLHRQSSPNLFTMLKSCEAFFCLCPFAHGRSYGLCQTAWIPRNIGFPRKIRKSLSAEEKGLDQRAQLLVGQVVRGFLCLMRCTFFSFLIR